MNIYWLKSSGKIGEKSITKNSENFNESTKISTKMSPKLVKIEWIHQNLHKFCRKSSWALIWKIVMNWRKKNGKDYQHLKTKLVKCCQNSFIFFSHNHLTFSTMSNLSKIFSIGQICQNCQKSKIVESVHHCQHCQKLLRIVKIINICQNLSNFFSSFTLSKILIFINNWQKFSVS